MRTQRDFRLQLSFLYLENIDTQSVRGILDKCGSVQL